MQQDIAALAAPVSDVSSADQSAQEQEVIESPEQQRKDFMDSFKRLKGQENLAFAHGVQLYIRGYPSQNIG